MQIKVHTFRKEIRCEMPPLFWRGGNHCGIISDPSYERRLGSRESALEGSDECEFVKGVSGLVEGHGRHLVEESEWCRHDSGLCRV